MQNLSRRFLLRSACSVRPGCRQPPLQLLRPFSYIPMSPPPLFDMCVRGSFKEALQRAKTHPHEARFKHPRNWTALHCCVEHVAPLEVVKAIYEAHPQNLVTKDWQGITPLQAAVDLDTQAFLHQQQQQQHDESNQNKETITTTMRTTAGVQTATPASTMTMTDAAATIGIISNSADDTVLAGKVLAHAERLSDQVTDLAATVNSLRKEIEELKTTLKAISEK